MKEEKAKMKGSKENLNEEWKKKEIHYWRKSIDERKKKKEKTKENLNKKKEKKKIIIGEKQREKA